MGPRRLAQRIVESLHPLLPDRVEMAALVAAGEVSSALERAERLVGSARFVDVARPLLDRGDARLPLVVRAVAALSPVLGRICTTNFDTLLERALGTWTALDAEPLDLRRRERCIVKLCGTAAQVSSWVLTRERLLARSSELPQTGSWLRCHRLLLVGYRADDEVLRRLLLALRGRDAAGAPPVNLAFVPEDSITPESRTLLGEHGVDLVPVAGDYDLAVAEQLHALVDAYERATGTRITAIPSRPRYEGHRVQGTGGPYLGLAPFSPRDDAQFFGRTGDVHRCIEQLRACPESRWLIVHGADGVGASSFVAAGLYPAIVRGAAWTLPGKPTWQGLRGRVDRRPLLALAEGLTSLAPWGEQEPEGVGDRSWEAATLHEEFSAHTRALTDRLASPHLHGLVLVIDGIEEAIDSDDDRECEQFAAVLAHALAHATAPFLLITPIRSRYLAELGRLLRLHERMIGRAPPVLYALAPIDQDGLRQIVREPGERAGLMVAERLVERILADLDRLTREPSAPPPGIVLAQLAAALVGTYRHMKHGEFCVTAYEAAGGLTGAVEQLAEQAIAATIEDYGESLVRQVFLTVIAGGVDRRGGRRPLTPAEVIDRLIAEGPATSPGENRTLAEQVLRRTTAAKVGLVVISERSVTLVHDVLLSHWPRLRAWQAPDWPSKEEADGRGQPHGKGHENAQAEAAEPSSTVDAPDQGDLQAEGAMISGALRDEVEAELPYLFVFAFLASASRSDALDLVSAALAAVASDPQALLSAPQPADALLQQLILVIEEQLGRKTGRGFELLENLLNERFYWRSDRPQVSGAEAMILLSELKRTCLVSVLQCLPPGVRIAFILVDIFGYPVTTTAALTRGKESSVRVRLTRARRRLDEFLRNRCGHIDSHNSCYCEGILFQALDTGFVTAPAVPQAAANETPPIADIGALYRSLPGAALDEAERERLLAVLASSLPPSGSRLRR
ncbi:SIR2 family protein [Nannocystis pusilla]|uniref:SIR2 family protein n=2 Tax=Nannocystis pusilla TaxID=889268 RepID=A0ABS7U0B2_9BACT|nr:SIR2 family protein [Nannocystis pusilla]